MRRRKDQRHRARTHRLDVLKYLGAFADRQSRRVDVEALLEPVVARNEAAHGMLRPLAGRLEKRAYRGVKLGPRICATVRREEKFWIIDKAFHAEQRVPVMDQHMPVRIAVKAPALGLPHKMVRVPGRIGMRLLRPRDMAARHDKGDRCQRQ